MRKTFLITGILFAALNLSTAFAADAAPVATQARATEASKLEKINTAPAAHDEKDCPMHKTMKNCPMHKGAAQEKCDHEHRG